MAAALFEDTAIFQIVGDARRAKAVIADPCGDTGGLSTAINHLSRIAVGQRSVAERLGETIDGGKERCLGTIAQTGVFEIIGEVLIEGVVAGNVVDFSSLLQ